MSCERYKYEFKVAHLSDFNTFNLLPKEVYIEILEEISNVRPLTSSVMLAEELLKDEIEYKIYYGANTFIINVIDDLGSTVLAYSYDESKVEDITKYLMSVKKNKKYLRNVQ